jgi:hypothetical protein
MLRAMLMLMRSVLASVLIAASTSLAMAAELVFDLEIRHGRVPDDKKRAMS